MYTHWRVQCHQKIMFEPPIFMGQVKMQYFQEIVNVTNGHNDNFRGPQNANIGKS